MYEEMKRLPENQTCYLHFFDDGQVVLTTKEVMVSGIYSFIGDEYIEITWNHPTQGLIWALGGNLFKVPISGNKMTLTCGGGGQFHLSACALAAIDTVHAFHQGQSATQEDRK